MASTAELLIQVRADTTQATSAISELEMQTRLLEQIMVNTSRGGSGGSVSAVGKAAEESTGFVGQLGEELGNIGKIALGMATGMAAADLTMGLAERFKQAAEATDKYGTAVLNVQRISGESAENSSVLVAMFERFAPSVDEATTRLARFERNLGEIKQGGGKKAAEALADFGVSATNADGSLKPTIEVLMELADGFNKSGDAATKNMALTALFGRGAQSMLLMLNQGRAGLQDFAADVKAYGLVLSQDNVDDVAKFIQAHKEMDLAMQGLSVSIGVLFMPLITSLAEKTANFATGIDTKIVPSIKRFEAALSPVAGKLQQVQDILKNFGAAGQDAGAGAVGALVPGLGALQTIGHALDTASAHPKANVVSGADATTAGLDDTTGDVAPNIKQATDVVDTAKSHLQEVQYQDDQRKADFDQAHVAAEQEALNLKLGQTEAEQALLTYKRQIEDIDRNSIDYALKRAQLDEQDAVTRAKMAESPLTAQNQDIKYQEDLIKAKLAAAHAGGAPVDVASAHQQLRDLQRQDARMQPDLLAAQHQTTLATRTQQSTDLQAQLENNDTARQKLDVQQAMVPLQDEVIARQRAAEDAQALLDLDKQRFALSEAGYKTELLLAEAAAKAAEHTLFVLQHASTASPTDTTAPVGETPVATATEGPATTNAAGSEQPNTGHYPPGTVGHAAQVISVNVGDIVHNGAMTAEDVWDSVKAKFVAAWDAALAHSPSGKQLGGAYVSGSNPR